MPPKPRSRTATRLVYGAFVVIVAAFVVSNVWQVARQVFVDPAAADAPVVGPACGALLAEEDASIRAAEEAALRAKDDEEARRAYDAARTASRARAPERERACAGDPQGALALAAFARLDRAAQAHVARRGAELSPVRLAAQSFIRVPK